VPASLPYDVGAFPLPAWHVPWITGFGRASLHPSCRDAPVSAVAGEEQLHLVPDGLHGLLRHPCRHPNTGLPASGSTPAHPPDGAEDLWVTMAVLAASVSTTWQATAFRNQWPDRVRPLVIAAVGRPHVLPAPMGGYPVRTLGQEACSTGVPSLHLLVGRALARIR
jgi:hypothetical protein